MLSSPFEPYTRVPRKNYSSSIFPWIRNEYACNLQGLHEEILEFYEYILPCKSEQTMRMELCARVKRIAVKKWPNVTVRAFGTGPLGLHLPTSSVAIVMIGNWTSPPLFALEEELRIADIACKHSLTVIIKANVPIVTFIDKETGLKVNICFNDMLCIPRREKMKEFKAQYPNLPILFFVIKQFLTIQHLDEPSNGGINSYHLFLMLTRFFETHSSSCPYENVLLGNLGVLLMLFLHYYAFSLKHPFLGRSLNEGGREFFERNLLIESNGVSYPGPPYMPDPLSPKVNAFRACFNFVRVRVVFQEAYNRLDTLLCRRTPPIGESLLSEILFIPLEVNVFREWVKTRWPPIPQSHPKMTPRRSNPARGAASSQLSNAHSVQ